LEQGVNGGGGWLAMPVRPASLILMLLMLTG